MTLQVTDDRTHGRYVAQLDGAVAGLIGYRLIDDELIVLHTEVAEAYEGQGVGSGLARHVLDDARARGLRVRPLCSFVRGWIERHPAYADLVP